MLLGVIQLDFSGFYLFCQLRANFIAAWTLNSTDTL